MGHFPPTPFTPAPFRRSIFWTSFLFLLRFMRFLCSISVGCRFFFPWPQQPAQQFDENVDRVALRRRYAPDDQWVVPHNLRLAARAREIRFGSSETSPLLPFFPRMLVKLAIRGRTGQRGAKGYGRRDMNEHVHVHDHPRVHAHAHCTYACT